ncbi:MAG: GAF domain-containing protein [Phototrophicaceae bacterium]
MQTSIPIIRRKGLPWLVQSVLQSITVAVTFIGIVLTIVYLVASLQWLFTPFPGFTMAYTLTVDGTSPFSDQGWNGLKMGVQRLDHLTHLNGELLTEDPTEYAQARARYKAILADHEIGDSLRFTFERALPLEAITSETLSCSALTASTSRCEVVITLQRIPIVDYLAFFVFPFLSGSIAVAVGAFLLVARPNQPIALLTVLFCVSLGIFINGLFNNSSSHIFVPAWYIATAIGGMVSFQIALTFPNRSTLAYRYPFLLYLPIGFGMVLIIYSVYRHYTLTVPTQFPSIWIPIVYTALASLAANFFSLLYRRNFSISHTQHDQINTALIGVSISGVPALVWFIGSILQGFGIHTLDFINSAMIMPLQVTLPISMAYAILQYRTLNTDRLLNSTLAYSAMLILLILGYAMMVLGINLFLVDKLPFDNPIFLAIAVFAVALLLSPLRHRIQTGLDRMFFRERQNYQSYLEKFNQSLSVERQYDEIIRLYVEGVSEILNPRSIFVFLPESTRHKQTFVSHHHSRPNTDLRFVGTHSLIPFLLKRPDNVVVLTKHEAWASELVDHWQYFELLDAQVISSIRFSDVLGGFTLIGKPSASSSTYSYEQIRFFENLTKQIAVAVERSQAVESLERRVQELSVLRQISEAVNYTIEFNDLLELLNSQTQKILRAPYFYIALMDHSTEQMFYAYFVEKDERLSELENIRWDNNRNLFYEVVRTEQLLRVANYQEWLEEQGYQPQSVNPSVRAWMGIPLIAGQSRLGVMAIASDDNSFSYTDEHSLIYRDLGSLTATLLDKARLFEETKLLARQLRALNDISRQLQTQRKVEPLLEMITSSAVNISNAEAGSLLLVDEDGQKEELVFKYVVGGSGTNLIGRRIPVGHGLVGEVGVKGISIVVNNPAQDARWQGEISGEFRTESVLAVPLKIENKVIGVLEILNKRRGKYEQRDIEVLETFAAQAAIAIENTRLYQQTDKQLEARVKELEALERIDVEINRTLNLNDIADITMRWAIENTGASAGVLGFVNSSGSDLYLEVSARYGYETEDFPFGAHNFHWTLERGIVRRTLRTRQSELAVDLKMDPDYIPSLRNANSQITIPMLSGGETTALLVLEKNTLPPLNFNDLAFVQRLAEHASIALDNGRLVQELNRANDSKGQFVAFVAHELKNPLTSVRGSVDLLRRGFVGAVTEKQVHQLNVILANAERMKVIINDLRDFEAMNNNKLKINVAPMDFREALTETLHSSIQGIEEKQQTLIQNIPDVLPLIMGDKTRLIQILTNFVSNANKYSPEGATITIQIRPIHLDRPRYPKSFLEISVADTGIGMNQEDLDGLFKPYFRSRNELAQEQSGTGLGLAITKSLILSHGGDVWVTSEIGKGTTFFFTVPLEDQPMN